MRPTDFDPIDDICNRGIVKDSDVAKLRRVLYGGEGIGAGDIEALFRINRTTRLQDPAWPAFFIEATCDYLLNELPPHGYLTAENGSWLIARISSDGVVGTATEMELLVTVLDQARWVPESIASFALAQVVRAIKSGEGPLRAGRAIAVNHVTADDVLLLRRILYAFGGDGNAAITRSEAEILFEIEEVTATGGQAPEWQELFVKAIASVIMSASGYRVPPREEALRREKWLAQRGDLSIGNFVGRIFSSYETQTPQERALARLERQRIEIITSETVSETDAGWLAERIGRDGRITANEVLLLAFIKRERPTLDPALVSLIERTTRAA